MKTKAFTGKFNEIDADSVAIAVFKDEKIKDGVLEALDKQTDGLVSSIFQSGEFTGEEGETTLLRVKSEGKKKVRRFLLVGVGEKSEYNLPSVEIFAGTAARSFRKLKISDFALFPRFEGDELEVASNAIQGVITGLFELDKYKTAKNGEETRINSVTVAIEGANKKRIEEGIERGKVIGESINFTRELANEPPNILTPTEMAKRAEVMAKAVGLKCEILDKEDMQRLGMGSFLSVAAGSHEPPKMIILKYEPKKSKKGEMLAFVGKGITFDTGGISLKPAEGMEAMKYDMTGGGTVLGIMRAIALLKPSVPVLGVVAATENMPGGKATRPSDVVKAMNGKTIEILNTDAEGRLILADAVAYAEKQGATHIVDIATLTGAVIIALGNINTGIMGNDQDFIDQIIQCGKETGEKFWQLPIGKEYSKMIKSDIADIKNIGPARKAGTIIGAVFIQEFVDKAKWAHLDIAGTAWADEPSPHRSKGPTGVAIKTLIKLTEKFQNRN
ncbi:MAG: leucyl aminopeptidase [Pyrinomonadaceae bacterium]|nr:leucyl aminopeptidase [Pyrinomonadaceae bacterium]MCX7640050.1 leucyl aminopeptidase [Pyrinomonadaceae bacterium]MDW8304222.1 leucyl aminopeptidase [Acidobacteriota bacterium]